MRRCAWGHSQGGAAPRRTKDYALQTELLEKDEKNIVEAGFTLVELLIVIVIMGILAGIVVFAVGNLTDTASKNSCSTDAASVDTAAEAYKASTGAYPTQMSDLTSGANKMLKSAPKSYNSTAADVKNQFRVTWGASFAIVRPADSSCPA